MYEKWLGQPTRIFSKDSIIKFQKSSILILNSDLYPRIDKTA